LRPRRQAAVDRSDHSEAVIWAGASRRSDRRSAYSAHTKRSDAEAACGDVGVEPYPLGGSGSIEDGLLPMADRALLRAKA